MPRNGIDDLRLMWRVGRSIGWLPKRGGIAMQDSPPNDEVAIDAPFLIMLP